jgi:hypothetical protein
MNNPPWSFDEKVQALKKDLASFDTGHSGRRWQVPFFGEPYTVSERGVVNASGQAANPAISAVLIEYVLNGGQPIDCASDPHWIGYRECRGAGPLMGYFQENTGKTLERTFAENLDALKHAALRLGSTVVSDDGSFDLSLRFEALSGLPVLLRFNDQDMTFPAACQVLFPESAQSLLDIRCLGVIGTYLTGRLITH